jgi:hypothetical protein
MSDLRQIPRHDWPPLIKTIADAIGDDAAITLFVKFAGRHLRIPITSNPNHIIDQAIGSDKATILRRLFAGETITFPSGSLLLIKLRNKRIISDYQTGMIQADIATKYHLSERQINHIVNHFRL